jgi:tetratricopeptide (TPR) repeat protein
VDFLKTSQYFYKGYIQRLASHFDGLAELRKIAHRLNLNTLSADDLVKVSEETKHLILLSCHATLLRLGDLSRYRNDIRTKDRSWDTAMSYYGLANDLYPKSGNAFNQMAVISLAEGQHLNAIYHLYRALAIDEPHPAAESNLEIEFKKITKEWASGSRRSVPNGTNPGGGAAGPLISWFVRLHAKLYKGEEFSGHDELENEVLSQMTVLLKEQPLEAILDKMVLINIAAEYFAAERLQSKC